jgi:hypothetical protein
MNQGRSSPNGDERADASSWPNGPRVARRALVLAALACRGSLDAVGPGAADVYARLRAWVDKLALVDELGPDEKSLLEAPLGSLEPLQAARATWHAEGLAVVAWALGRFDLPPHDEKVDPFEVTDAVGLLSDDAWLLDEPSLRPAHERSALRELLYALHCRLTDFRRHRVPRDVRGWFEPSWLEAVAAGDLLTDDGDVTLGGRPLTEASEARLEECLWITAERHRASIWLVDGSRSYASTTPDT